MLIDGGGLLAYGPRKRRTNFDTGEDVVSPYLWSRGIRRLDIVVATHAHEDHSGGLPAILENFHPRELWTGANPKQALLDQAARLHIPKLCSATPIQPSISPAPTIEILSPPEDFAPTKSVNNDSLAFRVQLRSPLLPAHRRHGKTHGRPPAIRIRRPARRRPQSRTSWIENVHNSALPGRRLPFDRYDLRRFRKLLRPPTQRRTSPFAESSHRRLTHRSRWFN